MSANDYGNSYDPYLDELTNEALADVFEYFDEEDIPSADEMEERDTAAEYFQLGVDCIVAGECAAAIIYFLKGAAAGLDAAENAVGVSYKLGMGDMCVDYRKAFEWFKRASSQGYPPAMCGLGSMYLNGCYVEQDYAVAKKWFKKAAEMGYPEAQCNLGYMYDGGKGVTQDYKKAYEWFNKSALQGYAEAQYQVGWYIYKGLGVRQDDTNAWFWFGLAAGLNYAPAMHQLGVMVEDSDNIYGEPDYSAAYEWYCKAAALGYADSMHNLGMMYLEGHYVTKDVTAARSWFEKETDTRCAIAEGNIKKC